MPARPVWKGHIRLALVSIPVEMYTAVTSGSGISFRQIHEPSGKPVHYEKHVEGVGEVDPDDIRKGFEYEKGSYVLLEEDEVDAVRLESRKTLELAQFVAPSDIPVVYQEKPYYLVPADDLAEQAYVVLREALTASGKVGIGQIAMRGRESIVAIRPYGKGMVAELLRYQDEVYKDAAYFRTISDAKPDQELLDMAEALIAKKTSAFDPTAFTDHYIAALRELIDEKLKDKGKIVTPPEEDSPAGSGNVIDLMAALKQSLGKETAKPATEGDKDTPQKKAG